MKHVSSSQRRIGYLILVLIGSFVLASISVGQDRDSQTAATAGRTPGHPAPLLSSASATAALGGEIIQAQPLPDEYYRKDQAGLALPAPLRVTRPEQLVCSAIR